MSLSVNVHDPRGIFNTPVADWTVYSGDTEPVWEGFRAITLRFDGSNDVSIYLRTSETARELAALFTRAALELAIEEGVKAAKAAARIAVAEKHAAAVEAADGDQAPTVDDLLALLR